MLQRRILKKNQNKSWFLNKIKIKFYCSRATERATVRKVHADTFCDECSDYAELINKFRHESDDEWSLSLYDMV